ncbi:MAG: metabolite traffic protein EboE [Chitinophagaceae bacterium]
MKTPFGHLTYCTNIHSGESWQDHFAQLQQHIPNIKENLSPQQPFGIGLRLSNKASIELSSKGDLDVFKSWLQANNCYVFTMNGFPYGGFHHTVVKDNVHAPDWLTQDRVDYTARLAHILAELLPEGMDGGISTSPLSYRYWFDGKHKQEEATAKATQNILAVLQTLIQIKKDTGKTIHLDIEPEPDGLLETGEECISWYKKTLLPAGIELLKTTLQYSEEEAVAAIKEHITLCYDVCHFAIGFEDGTQVVQQLKKEGIKVGKLQISAALKAALPQKADQRQKVFETFALFNEPVYLHQVVAQKEDGTLLRYRDLSQALNDDAAKEAKEWRAHFHVPLFAAQYGVLQSTQREIKEILQQQMESPFTAHLEVETYTWEVLQQDLKIPLTDSIIRELQWVQAQWLKEKQDVFENA